MAAINDAMLKSGPSLTVDLIGCFITNSILTKKQKTFDTETFIMGKELSDSEINYAQ